MSMSRDSDWLAFAELAKTRSIGFTTRKWSINIVGKIMGKRDICISQLHFVHNLFRFITFVLTWKKFSFSSPKWERQRYICLSKLRFLSLLSDGCLDWIVFFNWSNSWQLCLWHSVELRWTKEYTLHIGAAESGKRISCSSIFYTRSFPALSATACQVSISNFQLKLNLNLCIRLSFWMFFALFAHFSTRSLRALVYCCCCSMFQCLAHSISYLYYACNTILPLHMIVNSILD